MAPTTFLILRRPRSGRLEGRGLHIQSTAVSNLTKPPDMQAAVDVNCLAGGEGKGTACERGDGAADILAFAPARESASTRR